MRPTSSCICKYTSPVNTNTHFVILMHPKEQRKIKNGSGLMTSLQLKNSEVIVGVDFTNNIRVNELLDNEKSKSFLLYPGQENFNLSERKSPEVNSFMGATPTIFILDGTWPFARKMLKLSTNLQQLKRLSFDNRIKSKFVIKQQPKSLCLSTIESVYTVINLLKESNIEDCVTKDFLTPFEKMIKYQIESILNPNNNNYRPNKQDQISAKNNYMRKSKRNIVFEDRKNLK